MKEDALLAKRLSEVSPYARRIEPLMDRRPG